MVSPPSKRAAVRHLRERQGCSERRACKLVGTARSTARYAAKEKKEEDRLRRRICTLAGRRKRYGYRRIWAVLRRQGWAVNVKRVHRIWKEEGLGLPKKRTEFRPTDEGTV